MSPYTSIQKLKNNLASYFQSLRSLKMQENQQELVRENKCCSHNVLMLMGIAIAVIVLSLLMFDVIVLKSKKVSDFSPDSLSIFFNKTYQKI